MRPLPLGERRATRRVIALAAGVIVGLVGGAVYWAAAPREYEASAQAFISTAGSTTNGSELANAQTFVSDRMRSYAQVATSSAVLDPVIRQLGLPGDAADLAQRVSVDVPLLSVVITISARDSSAQRSADIANAVMQQLTTQISRIENPLGDKAVPVDVAVFAPAAVPTSSVSPRGLTALLSGALIGLVLGAIVDAVWWWRRRRAIARASASPASTPQA